MNKLDLLIQEHAPVVVVPKHENLPALQTTGYRYLVGQDGLKLEVRRPWLHAVVSHTISVRPGPLLPYGVCPTDKLEITCGAFPAGMRERFIGAARDVLPVEAAAWIVWDERTRRFDYVSLRALSSSPEHIHFERPELPMDTWLVMDLHSHGAARAFFSRTDDEDDAGEVKMAGVFGRLGRPEPEFMGRACLLGHFVHGVGA